MIEIKKIGNLECVSKIYHLGDIHIRNLRRHTEYKLQFEKLYSAIKNDKDDNSIIYVAGDLVHSKTDMSPELIDLVSTFLTELTKIAPTIIIAGNHDANLNNPDRLDALTPIITNLKNNNLYYLRDSGLYQFGNVIFSVMSILDDPSKYILAPAIPGDNIKIALYHGAVQNSTTNVGYNIHGQIDTTLFDSFDLTLLGDIHKKQYLNAENTIAYCSSLIQQNHGESYEDHGFLVWDLKTKTSKFFHLDNDFGFHTLNITDNELLPFDSTHITPKSKIRVKVSSTSDSAVQMHVSKIKQQLKISDVDIRKLDSLSVNNNIELSSNNNLDIRNIDTQNELIRNYLNLNLNLKIDTEMLNSVYSINRTCNLSISDKDAIARNVLWKPKIFEFSNMFSYGENNIIDFQKLNGIQGLFGPNASGKSSLLDALCFCLFDTTSRAYKADQIINTKKDWFECKFNFSISGTDYFIIKRGKRNPTTNKVKVTIEFWKLNSKGEKIILNGEQRRDTDAAIRSYIGSYEDFTLTCLSLQNNNTNFVEKAQTDRKEILAKFLDLNIFDSLNETANVEYKKILSRIENTNPVELDIQLQNKIEAKKLNEEAYTTILCDIENSNSEIKTKTDSIVELSRNIQITTTHDIDAIRQESIKKVHELHEYELEFDNIKDELVNAKSKLESAKQQYSLFDLSAIENGVYEYSVTQESLRNAEMELVKLESEFATQYSKLKKLSEYKYDPNCVFCMDNIFVKDAILAKDSIDALAVEIKKITYEIEICKSKLDTQSNILIESKKEKELKTEINSLLTSLQNFEIRSLTINNEIQKLRIELLDLNSKIETYETNKDIIEANKLLDNKIDAINNDILLLIHTRDEKSQEKLELYANSKLLDESINRLSTKLSEINDLIQQKIAYEYYLMATDKNGISYQLISKVMPRIENEVNNILSNLVDFKIILNTDGKNVNAFIVYADEYWPLELSSGMERFMASTAIRIALINVSSLPKPTFFAIDEGLGVLDSTNLNQVYMLFNYIRDVFKFVLVISHIDVVRDMVDNNLTIESVNGFSKIQLT